MESVGSSCVDGRGVAITMSEEGAPLLGDNHNLGGGVGQAGDRGAGGRGDDDNAAVMDDNGNGDGDGDDQDQDQDDEGSGKSSPAGLKALSAWILSGRGPGEARPSLVGFVLMSLCFSASHGSAVLGIDYASSVFDSTLGDFSNGILYLSYTLTSLLGATVVVDVLSPRPALCLAALCYVGYMALYALVMPCVPFLLWGPNVE